MGAEVSTICQPLCDVRHKDGSYAEPTTNLVGQVRAMPILSSNEYNSLDDRVSTWESTVISPRAQQKKLPQDGCTPSCECFFEESAVQDVVNDFVPTAHNVLAFTPDGDMIVLNHTKADLRQAKALEAAHSQAKKKRSSSSPRDKAVRKQALRHNFLKEAGRDKAGMVGIGWQ